MLRYSYCLSSASCLAPLAVLNKVHSAIRKITSGVAVRGDSGVAGEESVVGVPKFHSWVSVPCH